MEYDSVDVRKMDDPGNWEFTSPGIRIYKTGEDTYYEMYEVGRGRDIELSFNDVALPRTEIIGFFKTGQGAASAAARDYPSRPPIIFKESFYENPRKRHPVEVEAEKYGVQIAYLPACMAWMVLWYGQRLAGPITKREAIDFVRKWLPNSEDPIIFKEPFDENPRQWLPVFWRGTVRYELRTPQGVYDLRPHDHGIYVLYFDPRTVEARGHAVYLPWELTEHPIGRFRSKERAFEVVTRMIARGAPVRENPSRFLPEHNTLPVFSDRPIDGYLEGGVKERFLAHADMFLRLVGRHLARRHGMTEQSVRINRAGPAVGGEVYGEFRAPGRDIGAFVEVGTGFLGGMRVGRWEPRPDGVFIRAVWRARRREREHTPEGPNTYLLPSLAAEEVADELRAIVLEGERT